MIKDNWCVEEIENILFIVAFKCFTDNVELDDNEFKLLNITIDIAIIYIYIFDNIEFIDNEFNILNIVVDIELELLI